MTRKYQLDAEGRTQDHYFRFDEGLAQNESFEVMLNNNEYISQIVIQCTEDANDTKISVRLPSGLEYDIASFTVASGESYSILNDGNNSIFWSQLPQKSVLIFTKTDASPSSSGMMEVAITTRPPLQNPPELEGM